MLSIAHGDLASFLHIAGLVEFGAEEGLDPLNQRIPFVGAFAQDAETQVAQDFGSAAFAHPHVHGALIEPRLRRCEPRHGREEGDVRRSRFLRDWHPSWGFGVVEPQRPAIERLLVGVVEFEAAGPSLVLVDPLHNEVDPHVVCLLAAVDLPNVSHMEVAPQKDCARMRDGEQVPAVDRDARTLFRARSSLRASPSNASRRHPRAASACIAEVFPELFGPMSTTGLPNSTSTSPKRLKLRIVSLVSIADYAPGEGEAPTSCCGARAASGTPRGGPARRAGRGRPRAGARRLKGCAGGRRC